jgi:mono/diheme cytochrome c family protein
VKGGQIGPALDRRRRPRTAAFLKAHFKNPTAVTPGSVMPIIPVSDPEMEALILYVASLKPGASVPAIVLPPVPAAGAVPSTREGRALYQAVACFNCHAIGGRGTYVGPVLDNFGRSGRKLEWLLTHFREPDEVVPGTPMPAVRGSDRQLRSLALYCLSLQAEIVPTAALGQQIYLQRHCGHCHGSQGRGGKIGPRLAGVRRPGRTDAWLLEHIRDPGGVMPKTTMPRVWAADWEQQALLEYLKTLWLQDPAPGRRLGPGALRPPGPSRRRHENCWDVRCLPIRPQDWSPRSGRPPPGNRSEPMPAGGVDRVSRLPCSGWTRS